MVDARVTPVLEHVTRVPSLEADVVGVWLHINRGVGPRVLDRQALAVRGELEYFGKHRRALSPSASEAHEPRGKARRRHEERAVFPAADGIAGSRWRNRRGVGHPLADIDATSARGAVA